MLAETGETGGAKLMREVKKNVVRTGLYRTESPELNPLLGLQ
jgi:hypothetical protein